MTMVSGERTPDDADGPIGVVYLVERNGMVWTNIAHRADHHRFFGLCPATSCPAGAGARAEVVPLPGS